MPKFQMLINPKDREKPRETLKKKFEEKVWMDFWMKALNEIMNKILNFYDFFIHPTKNLIPHVCGPQSSPLRRRLLAAAPQGSNLGSVCSFYTGIWFWEFCSELKHAVHWIKTTAFTNVALKILGGSGSRVQWGFRIQAVSKVIYIRVFFAYPWVFTGLRDERGKRV